jgi:hypothetical protein
MIANTTVCEVNIIVLNLVQLYLWFAIYFIKQFIIFTSNHLNNYPNWSDRTRHEGHSVNTTFGDPTKMALIFSKLVSG